MSHIFVVSEMETENDLGFLLVFENEMFEVSMGHIGFDLIELFNYFGLEFHRWQKNLSSSKKKLQMFFHLIARSRWKVAVMLLENLTCMYIENNIATSFEYTHVHTHTYICVMELQLVIK